jgi:hypothetical protein
LKKTVLYIVKLIYKFFAPLFTEVSKFEINVGISSLLNCISQIETVEEASNEIQREKIPCITGEPVLSIQKQPTQKKPTPVVDFKEQFIIWSQNMKEYDGLRNRLINTI